MPPSHFASPRFRRPAPANRASTHASPSRFPAASLLLGLALAAPSLPRLAAQSPPQVTPTSPAAQSATTSLATIAARRARIQRFLAEHAIAPVHAPPTANPQTSTTPALALQRARAQHLLLLQQRSAQQQLSRRAQAAPRPRGATANLTAAWQPLGPSSIVSPTFGNLTGRITAIAPDPNDPTGNTVYLGTTGGGVWKSTTAAGALSGATFTPLTDTLPAFSANAGASVVPSLSIGAVAVQPSTNPVILAGTGDPNDATDSLYGEGLLRSTDGGLTWALVQGTQPGGTNTTYSFSGLATAGLAFSTATPSLVVAAFSVSPQSAIVNAAGVTSIPGLYYSTDAGQTWQMATLYDGGAFVQGPQPIGTGQTGNAATSVVWDVQRGQFFAAVRSHGYYSSPDGATWTRLAAQPGTNLTTANCPVGANGAGSPNCPIFRGTLAVQPATGDLYALTVDANNLDQGLWQDLCNTATNACATPEPTFAHRIDNGALEVGNGSAAITQGSYNLTLAAAPAAASSTLLFAGTVDLYRCSLAANSSSCTLRNTTNVLDGCNAPAAVAPAQHALAAIAQSSGTPILFLGNDGGLWRSLDGIAETGSVCSSTDRTHFDNLNAAIGAGGSLAEITGLAEHPTDPKTLLAGLGANGTAATTAAAQLTAWPQLSEGEGGFPLLDPNTPTDWYISIGAGVNLSQCTLGSACAAENFIPPATIGEPQVDQDAALLDAPTLLDPNLTTNLLAATCRVWRGPASSGATWSDANAISPEFGSSTPAGSATACTSSSPLVRSLAAGGPAASSANSQLSGSDVIYAGLAGSLDGGGSIPGHLFVTTTANTAPVWTDAALSPVTNDPGDANLFNPAAFDISSIVADPHDATGATVYATVMGFGAPHLYRSVDFGQHWFNISSNLPDAPANAVLVDPNDANTVYVALDTGVYATQQISTCATANCWSVLGNSLPNAPVTALAASAALPTGDGRLGLLRAATYGRGIWQQPLLTATFPVTPALTLSASSLTFAAQQVGTQSISQTLTLTSTGNAPVVFGNPAGVLNSGDFQIQTTTDTCSGQTLAVNSTCTLQIVFAPTATGPRSGQLTIYANISGGQATVSLTGTGTAPASILLTPLSLNFPATLVNQTSVQQIVTVSNTGGNTATLQSPVITGNTADFTLAASTCGATLAPSTACSLSIAFTPTASGARSATLSMIDSAGTQTATLTGSGNAPATDTLAPLALTFAQQQIGTSSPAQAVTLTNTGDVALTLITAAVTPGDFAVTNACGNSLAAHSTCALNVIFIPSSTGARAATLTVTDQFRSQTVSLTGTGVAPPGVSLSPSSLSFPATGAGLASAPQSFTLTNNGGLPLAISSLAASPGFVIATNTCGTTLAVNSACTLQLVFAPTAAGSISGALSLTDNAPTPTQTATLTGTGIDFSLAAAGPTSATISSGSSASFPLLLNSLAGLSGNVSLACTGAPAHSTCTVTPSTTSLGGTVSVVATVDTGLAVVDLAPPPPPFAPRSRSLFLALLLPLPLVSRRRSRKLLAPVKLLLPLLCVAFILSALSGCGAARTIPATTVTTTSTPTTPGSYNLTVTASAAGLTRSVGLTLTVQ